MSDSLAEGVAAEIARRHKDSGANPRKVSGWVKEGMPTDSVETAEGWMRSKKRGNFGKVATKEAKEESSALDDILKEATMASPGVLGEYARARAVSVKCYKAIMATDEPSATLVGAHTKAQEAVIIAKDAVADYLIQCRRLIPQEDIMAALQAQDGVSMGLLASFPYTLAPLLVGQTSEVITAELINWRDGTYLAKRLESEPFAETKEKSYIDDVLSDAEAEKEEGGEE
jgi:hypothetical protein